MFEANTVFVVGAGASASFGFPVGSTLRATIAQELELQRYMRGDYSPTLRAYLNASKRDHDATLRSLAEIGERLFGYDSIDEFIDGQQSETYAELGKFAIAQIISEHEVESEEKYLQLGSAIPTYMQRLAYSWPGLLATRMSANVRVSLEPELLAKNVAFIVFNYDRLLEHFLYSWFMRLGVPKLRAAKIVSSIPIIHPYGSLGELDWQGGEVVAPYADTRIVSTAARSIKTFTEQVAEGDVLGKVRTMIQGATKVVFLGFGFHQQNTRLLFAEPADRVQRVFVTTHGVASGDKERIDRGIDDWFGPRVQRNLVGQSCDDFAKDWLRNIAAH